MQYVAASATYPYLLYAGILKATERWTHPIQNWNLTLSQLTIHFPDRLEKYISL
jgi:transposase-like protein